MAQTLFVKSKDAQGRVTQKKVQVIRSWQESDGRQLYLHLNGVYGYKDGSPIRSEAELDIIASPVQRKAAQRWWDLAGKKMSAEHYAVLEEKERELYESQIPAIEGDVSDLDAIMYIRRPIRNRSRAAYSEPHTWLGWFQSRPDWWGHANVIELGEHRYEIVPLDETPETDDESPDEDATTEDATTEDATTEDATTEDATTEEPGAD